MTNNDVYAPAANPSLCSRPNGSLGTDEDLVEEGGQLSPEHPEENGYMADEAQRTRDRPRCLEAALDYEKRGFSVILLHGIVGGRCSCRNASCGSPGKHPIGKSWKGAQTKRATAAELKEAFSRHPYANIGIVTGAISGLVVVDLDGTAGMASCRKIMAGQEPHNVPTVKTGGGHHLYGRHPGTLLKNFVKNHPGLDGRADGGYVVAPPSLHASGRAYEWTRPLENELPELPPELLALFSSSEGSPKGSTKKRSTAGDAEETLEVAQPQRRVPGELRKYVEKALADECAIVAAAAVGMQENTLCIAALKIGSYVGARLLDFDVARDALVAAGLQMANDPKRSPWTRAQILEKVEAKLRIGTESPKWGPDPRGEEEDRSPPLDVFGDADLTGSPAFPTDALPLALSDFVADRAERLGVGPEMIPMPALAACAAALDDRHVVQVRRNDQQWTESARLWVAIVDEPGGKKTPAIKAATDPLQEIEMAWGKEDGPKFDIYRLQKHSYDQQLKRSRTQADHNQLAATPEPQKPPHRRLIVSDVTIEKLAHILAENPAGLIALYDELTQLLGSFDAYRPGRAVIGRDRSLWLELYNGGRRSVDRVTTGHIEITNWGASMVGGIQPGRLRGLISDLSDDGLLQRFIPVFGSGPSMGVDRRADEEADRAYRRVLETIGRWRDEEPIRVTLSPEAHEARERVMSNTHALTGLPTTPGPLKNHLNKWEALFARILLTMHAVEFAPFGLMPAEILKVTAERVEKLMLDYLLPNAIRFYGEFYGRDKHVEHASWIAGYILAHRCCLLNSRDAYRARNEFREPQVLDRAMAYLEMAGWIVPMSKGHGKRTTLWWVDPRVHQLFVDRAVAERTRRKEEMRKIQRAAAALKRAA